MILSENSSALAVHIIKDVLEDLQEIPDCLFEGNPLRDGFNFITIIEGDNYQAVYALLEDDQVCTELMQRLELSNRDELWFLDEDPDEGRLQYNVSCDIARRLIALVQRQDLNAQFEELFNERLQDSQRVNEGTLWDDGPEH